MNRELTVDELLTETRFAVSAFHSRMNAAREAPSSHRTSAYLSVIAASYLAECFERLDKRLSKGAPLPDKWSAWAKRLET